jgi:hypothetical protein
MLSKTVAVTILRDTIEDENQSHRHPRLGGPGAPTFSRKAAVGASLPFRQGAGSAHFLRCRATGLAAKAKRVE